MHSEIKTIAGIRVVFAEMRDAPSTTVQVLVKAGSVYETRETNGLSHFLEHMFFKGGKRYTSAKAVTEALDTIGASFNAFTGDEYAGYWVKSAPQFIEKSIDVLSDMLVHSTFPAEEIEREKGVIIQEMKGYQDVPQHEVRNRWKRRYFGDNVFGRPVIGTQENVASFTQSDFLRHKEALYTKDNLVIVVAGALPDRASIESMIGEYFGGLPERSEIQAPMMDCMVPDEHQASSTMDTQQHHLVIGASGRSMNDPHRYAASMLSLILGGMMSSRLFMEVREKKGLCYYIGSSVDQSVDHGTFFIYGGIEKARREEALSTIYSEVQKLVDNGVTDAEFEKARLHIQGSIAMSIETSHKLAGYVGKQALFRGDVLDLETVLGRYLDVTKTDMLDVAQKLMHDNLYAYRVK